MEIFADIVRIKMSFLCMSWAQLGNYITIICLKANLVCSGLLFISPQSGKEKKPICWRLTIHYHRLTEKKFPCCLVVWQGVYLCFVFGRIREKRKSGALCFLRDSFTCGFCWMAASASWAVTTSGDSHVSVLLRIPLSFSMGESCFVVVFHFDSSSYQVCLWCSPSLFVFSVIFMLSLTLCISIFDTLTLTPVSPYLPLCLVLNEY